MRKIIALITPILFWWTSSYGQFVCNRPEPSQIQTPFAPGTPILSSNGWAFTPQGEITTFIYLQCMPVYRRDPPYGRIDSAATQNEFFRLQSDVSMLENLFYDSVAQFSPTATDHTISNILYQNSIHSPDPLMLMGYVFPEVIPLGANPSTYITNYFQTHTPPLQGQIDNRTGEPRFASYIVNNGSDNILDYVTRYTNDGAGGFAWQGGVTFTLPNGITLTSSSIPSITVTRETGNTHEFRYRWLHEFNHTIPNQLAHYAGANGHFGKYFHCTPGASLMNAGVINYFVNAEERKILGWLNLPPTHDLQEPSPVSREVILSDFASTNSALRIKVPGQSDQYLWFEYYGQTESSLDYCSLNRSTLGDTIPKANRGLRAYIMESNQTANISKDIIRPNGMRQITAAGNKDFRVQSTKKEANWDSIRVSDVGTIQLNPTSDQCFGGTVRDNIFEIDNTNNYNNIIKYQATGSIASCGVDDMNEQANFLIVDGEWVYNHYDLLSFNGVGTKLGLNSNPILSLHHRKYDACKNAMEPINLSGLSVEITEQAPMAIKLRIRWDDVTLNQPSGIQLLTGELVVNPALNTTDVDLIIAGRSSLALAKSNNRRTRTPWDDSFTNPTVLKSIDSAKIVIENNGYLSVEDNSSVWLRDKSTLIIKNGGRLCIKGGASLVLSNTAQLVVEPGGILTIEDGAFVCIGPNATLAASNIGGGISVAVGAQIGASPSFIGYCQFTPLACQEFCNRSTGILKTKPKISGVSTVTQNTSVSFSVANSVLAYTYSWQINGVEFGIGSSKIVPSNIIGKYRIRVISYTGQGNCSDTSDSFTYVVTPRCDSKIDNTVAGNDLLINSADWTNNTYIDGMAFVSGSLNITNANILFSNRVCEDGGGCTIDVGNSKTFTIPFGEPLSGIVMLPGSSLRVFGSNLNSYNCAGMWAGIWVSTDTDIRILRYDGNLKSSISNSKHGLVVLNPSILTVDSTLFYNNLRTGLSLVHLSQSTALSLTGCSFVGDGATMLSPYHSYLDSLTSQNIQYWPQRGIEIYTKSYNLLSNLGSGHYFSGLVHGIDQGGDNYSGIVQISDCEFERCFDAATSLYSQMAANCKIRIPKNRPEGMDWLTVLSESESFSATPGTIFEYGSAGNIASPPPVHSSVFGTLGMEIELGNSQITKDRRGFRSDQQILPMVGCHILAGAEARFYENTFTDLDTATRFAGASNAYGAIPTPGETGLISNRFINNKIGVAFHNSILLTEFSCNTFQVVEDLGTSYPIMAWIVDRADAVTFKAFGQSAVPASIGSNNYYCQSKFVGFNNPFNLILSNYKNVITTSSGTTSNNFRIKYYRRSSSFDEYIDYDRFSSYIAFVAQNDSSKCTPFAGAQNRGSHNSFSTFRRHMDTLPLINTANVPSPASTSLYPTTTCLGDIDPGVSGSGYNSEENFLSAYTYDYTQIGTQSPDSCYFQTPPPLPSAVGNSMPVSISTIHQAEREFGNPRILNLFRIKNNQLNALYDDTSSNPFEPESVRLVDSCIFYKDVISSSIVKSFVAFPKANTYIRKELLKDSAYHYTNEIIKYGKYYWTKVFFPSNSRQYYRCFDLNDSTIANYGVHFISPPYVVSFERNTISQFQVVDKYLFQLGSRYQTGSNTFYGIEIINLATGRSRYDTVNTANTTSNSKYMPLGVVALTNNAFAVLATGPNVNPFSPIRSGSAMVIIYDSLLVEQKRFILEKPRGARPLRNVDYAAGPLFVKHPSNGGLIATFDFWFQDSLSGAPLPGIYIIPASDIPSAVVSKPLQLTPHITLYPNPVTQGGLVTLQFSSSTKRPTQANLRLMDARGQVIYQGPPVDVASEKSMTFRIPASCSIGLYTLQVVTAEGRYQYLKVLVQ